MNRHQQEPINLDDPRLTAYALGEMPVQEQKEFEELLDQSPVARKELDATNDVMSLLTEGLKDEWTEHAKAPVSFSVIEGGPISENEKAENEKARFHLERQRQEQEFW